MPCLVCLMSHPSLIHRTVNRSDPHHVPEKGKGGKGMVASDYRVIPLCRVHHREAHLGRETFAEKHSFDYEMVISRLNTLYKETHGIDNL